MTWKEAEKLKPGAIVRESWDTTNNPRTGLVLALSFEAGKKKEFVLGQVKDKRYLVTVHWLPSDGYKEQEIRVDSSWNIMVVSHAQ